MRKLYTSPQAEIVEFDVKDVITTSGLVDEQGGSVNDDNGWIPGEY